MFDVIIVGGGAAGFFTAINIAEKSPQLKIAILERGKEVLTKVKISGGGRCNVTHAEFDPSELAKNYPRGEKELIGPFHSFASGDTMAFFEERGVPLKIEEDGRIFPVSDSSQTIIDCFWREAERLGVKVLKHSAVTDLKHEGKFWNVTTIKHQYQAKKIVVATGSNPKIWKLLQHLGHKIVNPVPSLFTFNCSDSRISGIPGVSTPAHIQVFSKNLVKSKINVPLKSNVSKKPLLTAEGPVLITHWGLSGPAVLRLSAWGARILNELSYQFTVEVNWAPEYTYEGLLGLFTEVKNIEGKKTVARTKALDVPKRLWSKLVSASSIGKTERWADVNKYQLTNLALQLTQCELTITGKSTFKEEFVTAGGVDLKEVDFKSCKSKLLPNLYFAGEVMNIDAITGGFNFQNAWTNAYLVAEAITTKE